MVFFFFTSGETSWVQWCWRGSHSPWCVPLSGSLRFHLWTWPAVCASPLPSLPPSLSLSLSLKFELRRSALLPFVSFLSFLLLIPRSSRLMLLIMVNYVVDILLWVIIIPLVKDFLKFLKIFSLYILSIKKF